MEVAFNAQGSSWSSSTIAAYGRQMLLALSTLHTAHKMVFVDVKPDNFAFGMPGTACAGKIFLLDFGLSERYTGAGGVHKLQVSNHVLNEQRASYAATQQSCPHCTLQEGSH
jgi:serine/threonine protein kinase